MRQFAKKWLLALVIFLCILVLLSCFLWVRSLQKSGWYEGSAEEGIAHYAEVEQENVLIHKSLQDESFLYTVWEYTATGEIGMTILQKQQWLGRDCLRPWGSVELGSMPYLEILWTEERGYPNTKSLIVAVCDNRDGSLDYCELEFLRNYNPSDPQSSIYVEGERWSERIPLTESFMLQVHWFPDDVVCKGGAVFDHEGKLLERYGAYGYD